MLGYYLHLKKGKKNVSFSEYLSNARHYVKYFTYIVLSFK